MSSHHFVRDKQEPLLIVQSLAPDLMEFFIQLLEWSPETVLFDSKKNISLIESYDLNPDWLFDEQTFTLTNTYTAQRIKLPNGNLQGITQQLKYTTYNTIVAMSFTDFRPKLKQLKTDSLIKIILKDALIQSCKNHYIKWLPKHSQLFIYNKNLECLNIDLNLKNTSFVTYRKSDGFEMFLKTDYLLKLSFGGNFEIVEFF